MAASTWPPDAAGISCQRASAFRTAFTNEDVSAIKRKTGNLYQSIAIIAKRANQINIALKEELHNKLEEFASHTDSLEEIHENKEQIEISKAYEKMPNPSLLACQEFLDEKVYYRKNETDLFS